jgi:hypothetical protein
MQITFIMSRREMVALGHTQPSMDLPEPDEGTGGRSPAAVSGLPSDWPTQTAAPARIAGHDGPVPGWRLIRAAEAGARQAGLRASIPDPVAARTPQYATDLARWGTGEGTDPDGPDPGYGLEAGA